MTTACTGPVSELRGVLTFHSETGTEGGYWAFQDERFMMFPDGRWSNEGLHVLKDGDRLTIFDKDEPGQVIWSGTIDLIPHPLFTEAVAGMWVHADQRGQDREAWARLFFEEHPAVLVRDDP